MSLLTPDFGLVFWMLVCFLIVLFILGKYAWPAIINMIKKRGDYIEESLDAAKKANEKLQNIKDESDKIRKDAETNRVKMMKEATEIKEQLISDAKKQAEVEAKKVIENAKKSIQQEKENALKEIRAEITNLSVAMSEKVLRKELTDKKSQVEMINRLLDEINVVNNS